MSAVPKPRDDSLDEARIDQAPSEAHIPSLMMALVHLTGDASHLKDDRRPVYDFWGDGQGNIKPEGQAEIREAVKRAYLDYGSGGQLPPPRAHDTIRRLG